MFIDAHAHYEDEAFQNDLAEVMKKICDAGCEAVVDAASDLETAERILRLTRLYSFIYGAFGVHPHEAGKFRDEDFGKILDICREEKCVAVGEIGLDYHYDFSTPDRQKEVFRKMIRMAMELGKPIVVHDREAHQDTLDILQEEGIPGEMCLIHCFSGSREMAEICMKRGYSVSLGGAVTFKNARRVIEALEVIPMDRILLETDCPYMTPEPHRGTRNDSSLIPLTAKKISEVKGSSPEEVMEIAKENSLKFYKINRQ